jgi:hypothetical protein
VEIKMPGHQKPDPGIRLVHGGNLLNAAVRRDIADLNLVFLERALDPALADDPWFRLPRAAVATMRDAPARALERAAHAPVGLFELSVPDTTDDGWHGAGAVADAQSDTSLDRSRIEARRSFALVALGVARRLAENVPLSPRIVFGVGARAEGRLSALSPAESFVMAAWSGLVRPRWAGHEHYWAMLASSAVGDDEIALQWAYAAGVCLIGQGDLDTDVCAALRRRSRAPR